jgi:hypothetical protein
VPCRAVPCRAVPCRAVPCRAVPCRAVPCRAVPCRAVPYCDSGYPPSAVSLQLTPLLGAGCHAVQCCASAWGSTLSIVDVGLWLTSTQLSPQLHCSTGSDCHSHSHNRCHRHSHSRCHCHTPHPEHTAIQVGDTGIRQAGPPVSLLVRGCEQGLQSLHSLQPGPTTATQCARSQRVTTAAVEIIRHKHSAD